MVGFGKTLVVFGLIFVVLGLLFWVSPKVPWIQRLGRLPGDIYIERDGFKFYFPWVTCLVVSALITLAVKLFKKL